MSRFPKSVRLLRSSDFRRVYDNGTRHTCAYFAAFWVVGGRVEGLRFDPPGPHVGFTTPKALGKAVVRNRIRRRMREAVRLELDSLSTEWAIVFNPRRKLLTCTLPELRAEVRRLFERSHRQTAPLPDSSSSTSA